jgi:hypothetical protein
LAFSLDRSLCTLKLSRSILVSVRIVYLVGISPTFHSNFQLPKKLHWCVMVYEMNQQHLTIQENYRPHTFKHQTNTTNFYKSKIWSAAFWCSGYMEPFSETLKKHFEVSKNSFPRWHMDVYYICIKFHEKIHWFVSYTKKWKSLILYSNNTHTVHCFQCQQFVFLMCSSHVNVFHHVNLRVCGIYPYHTVDFVSEFLKHWNNCFDFFQKINELQRISVKYVPIDSTQIYHHVNCMFDQNK